MLRRASLLLPSSLRASRGPAASAWTTWQSCNISPSCTTSPPEAQASSSAATIASSARLASDGSHDDEQIGIMFIDKDGKENYVEARLGKNILEIANDNEIELEGACEGSLACSTCHVIVQDKEYYKKIPEPSDDELDMLDMAFGLTDMSRLGCQVIATKDIDGISLAIPNPATATKKK